jgi:MinD-like ATPase involved in chromosome partitioning or flagellar assembly
VAAATRVFFVAAAGPRPRPAATARRGFDDGPGSDTSGPAGASSAELAVAEVTPRLARVRREWRSLDYQARLDQVISRPRLRRCATVAIVSPKGGVGKTTLTALLGTLLADLRRDHIVAVDANPDFGSLGRVLAPAQPWFVDDILQLIDQPDLSLSALDAHLGRAVHGLLVVPSPTDPARMQRLDQDAYGHVIERLKSYSGLVLLDCGTGLHEPAARAAIDACDQVLLVTDGEPATASLVAEAARLLRAADRPVTVVVNKMPRRRPQLDVRRLAAAIPEARGLVVVPAEPAAASALGMGRFDWRDAPVTWQTALRELAVVVLADHARLGISLPPSWPGRPV